MLDPSDFLGDAGLRNFRWQTTYGSDFCSDFKEPPHLPVLKCLYAGSCSDSDFVWHLLSWLPPFLHLYRCRLALAVRTEFMQHIS